MTSYDLCLEYMRRSVLRFAEVQQYQWSDEFKIKQIDEFAENLIACDGFKRIDPNSLSLSEMKSLGFSPWDDSGLMLIPLWILPYLSDEFEAGCISGEKSTVVRSNIDIDHRFGCVSYGVFPSESEKTDK